MQKEIKVADIAHMVQAKLTVKVINLQDLYDLAAFFNRPILHDPAGPTETNVDRMVVDPSGQVLYIHEKPVDKKKESV